MDPKEVARGLVDAVNAQDREAIAGLLSEDVVLTPPPSIEWDGVRHGREEALRYFEQTWERVPGYRQDVESVDVEGDEVVLRGQHRGPDDLTLGLSVWLTVRDDQVTRYRSSADAGEALRVQAELPPT